MALSLWIHCVLAYFANGFSDARSTVILGDGALVQRDKSILVRREAKSSSKELQDSASKDAENPCSSCACSFIGRDGTPTNCDIEINSRRMVKKWIPENATTLEVGARYGSVSCAIAENLKQSGKQVSVDADHRVWDALEKNRISHNCTFHTVHGLLAQTDGRIFENGFGTVAADPENFGHLSTVDSGVVVPHFTFDEIQNTYNLKFDTGEFDCEGCFAFLLKDFPELKSQLKLIILEQHNEGEANATADLLTHGWVMVDRLSRQRVFVNKGMESGVEHVLVNEGIQQPGHSVQWTFETGSCPTRTMGRTCLDICAEKQLSCDQNSMQLLSSEEGVRAAFESAGYPCQTVLGVPVASYFDGPTQVAIPGQPPACSFNTHPSGFGLCEGSSVCGYRRICPCM